MEDYLGHARTEQIDFDSNSCTAHFTQATPGSANIPAGIGGNAAMLFTQYSQAASYNAQLAFGFESDKLAIRTKRNSPTWSNDWRYFYPDVKPWTHFQSFDILKDDRTTHTVSLASASPKPLEVMVIMGIRNENSPSQLYGGHPVVLPYIHSDVFFFNVTGGNINDAGIFYKAYVMVYSSINEVRIQIPYWNTNSNARVRVFYR